MEKEDGSFSTVLMIKTVENDPSLLFLFTLSFQNLNSNTFLSVLSHTGEFTVKPYVPCLSNIPYINQGTKIPLVCSLLRVKFKKDE